MAEGALARPLIIKGILSPEDARQAREIGATAIMVSNHGGRQLDSAAAPIGCIPAIRDAVGDDLELIVDGGVRRGSHIFKALALGASACSVGRPTSVALARAESLGSAKLLTYWLQNSVGAYCCQVTTPSNPSRPCTRSPSGWLGIFSKIFFKQRKRVGH